MEFSTLQDTIKVENLPKFSLNLLKLEKGFFSKKPKMRKRKLV